VPHPFRRVGPLFFFVILSERRERRISPCRHPERSPPRGALPALRMLLRRICFCLCAPPESRQGRNNLAQCGSAGNAPHHTKNPVSAPYLAAAGLRAGGRRRSDIWRRARGTLTSQQRPAPAYTVRAKVLLSETHSNGESLMRGNQVRGG
jgi:hypothetical protein